MKEYKRKTIDLDTDTIYRLEEIGVKKDLTSKNGKPMFTKILMDAINKYIESENK